MALPKRRHSRSRSRWRRSHDALSSQSFTECPNCGQEKLPHRVCGNCGHYEGKKVLEVEES